MPTDDTSPSRSKRAPGGGPKRRLGEILVAGGAVTAEQLAHALSEQGDRQLPLGQTLIALGYTTDEVMRQALSSQLGVPYIDLKNVIIDKTLAPLLDREFARQHVLFPVARVGQMITVAMDDPTASQVVEDVARQTGHDVTVVTSSHDGILRALARMYDGARPTEPASPTGAAASTGPAEVRSVSGGEAAHEYVSLLGLTAFQLPDLLRTVEAGLAVHTFDVLVASSGLPEDAVARLSDISLSTLAARRADGRFARDESDRLVRAARIFGAALALFNGDRATAGAWLQSAQPALGGVPPVDLARTDLGAREVERALSRLRTSAQP